MNNTQYKFTRKKINNKLFLTIKNILTTSEFKCIFLIPSSARSLASCLTISHPTLQLIFFRPYFRCLCLFFMRQSSNSALPRSSLKTSKKAAILNAWSDDRAVKQDSFSIPELNYQLSWAPKKTSK